MKNKTSLLIIIFVLSGFLKSKGQLADSIKIHIDSSLAVLENNSLYAKSVSWPDIRERVYAAAGSARTKAGTFPALKIAFDALGDKHAAFYQYDDEYRIPNDALMLRYTDSIKAAWKKGSKIVKQMIGTTAYIRVPFMGAGKQEDIDKYANWLNDAVVELQKNNPANWIIDLRLNGGGNIRPMLAGLAAFFEDGVVGYCIERDGTATDESAFSNRSFTINGISQATIKNMIPSLANAKVAVLIGPGTASSGEGVGVIFRQRKCTMLFGEQSAGLANATNGFVFNNNNSYFLLSVANLGNKNKEALPEYVTPDVTVKSNDAFNDLSHDTVVKAAIRWLDK